MLACFTCLHLLPALEQLLLTTVYAISCVASCVGNSQGFDAYEH